MEGGRLEGCCREKRERKIDLGIVKGSWGGMEVREKGGRKW